MLDLVLLRHGQSDWNAKNLFTGWVDVDLTGTGEEEARAGGELLAATGDLDLRLLHTSVLTRAIRTADIALAAAGRSWLPVRRHSISCSSPNCCLISDLFLPCRSP